jgi:hypothetical protein
MIRVVVGRLRWRGVGALVVAACSVGEGSENASSFGSATVPGTTVPVSASDSGTATDIEDDDGSASGESAASSGGGASTSDGSTSAVGSSGSPTSTDPTTDPTTGMGTGQQPEMGMYSPCMMAAECVGLTYCATVTDAMGGMSGYCTNLCETPAADCDPTPGGTAEPICFPFGEDGGDPMLCALDCSGGQTCPTPMMCYPLTGGSICA